MCGGRVQPAAPVVVDDQVGEIAGVMVGVFATGVLAVRAAVRVEVAAGTAEGDPSGVGAHEPMAWMCVPCRPAASPDTLTLTCTTPAGVLGEDGEAGDTGPDPGDRGAGMDRAVLAAPFVAINAWAGRRRR